jgi:hypothetical protein
LVLATRKGGGALKRLLFVISVAGVAWVMVFALSGAAGATHSKGQGSNKDFVNGTGKLVLGEATKLQIHVNAQSGPNGEDARGRFFARQKGPPFIEVDVRGKVLCLDVHGNTAVFGGVVTQSRIPTVPEGGGVLIEVIDSGEPDVADRADGYVNPEEPYYYCSPAYTNPIKQGNYIVHDATS